MEKRRTQGIHRKNLESIKRNDGRYKLAKETSTEAKLKLKSTLRSIHHDFKSSGKLPDLIFRARAGVEPIELFVAGSPGQHHPGKAPLLPYQLEREGPKGLRGGRLPKKVEDD